MRRRILVRIACVGVALALGSVAPASGQIGVLAGYNRDRLEEFVPANGFDLTDTADGFHIGIFFNVNIGTTFAVRPAVIYHRVPDLVAQGNGETTQFDVELIEVPLDLRIRLPIPLLQPYVLAGPVLTFPSSSVSGVNDLLGARPIRAEFGVGLELDLGFRLWPELRYGLGVESLMESGIPIGDGTLQGQGRPRLDTFTFRLGISF